MFTDEFFKSTKWVIFLADLALITFLTSRMAPVVIMLNENTDISVFGSVTAADLFALVFVLIAFGSLVFCWYGLQKIHLQNDEAYSENFIRAVVYIIIPVVILLEGASTYISFHQDAFDPFDPHKIGFLEKFVHILMSVAIVIFHLIVTYATARVVSSVIDDGSISEEDPQPSISQFQEDPKDA